LKSWVGAVGVVQVQSARCTAQAATTDISRDF
jgi:hypothetical protein